MQLDGGCIVARASKTVYLTCPAQIVKELRVLGLDLGDKQKRGGWKIEASLEVEETPEGRRKIRVSHDFIETYTGASV